MTMTEMWKAKCTYSDNHIYIYIKKQYIPQVKRGVENPGSQPEKQYDANMLLVMIMLFMEVTIMIL